MSQHESTEGHLRAADYVVRTVDLATCHRLVAGEGLIPPLFDTACFKSGAMSVSGWLGGYPPTKTAAIASYSGDWTRVVSLSRLVVHPDVPTNGASFSIGRSIRLIRQDGRFRCLVTYADSWQHHTGSIYKATNWEYVGDTAPESVWVDDIGRMVARKAGPKTRTKSNMEALGYLSLGRFSKRKYRIVL